MLKHFTYAIHSYRCTFGQENICAPDIRIKVYAVNIVAYVF